jgi:flagellar hook-basal body complex protein FliE
MINPVAGTYAPQPIDPVHSAGPASASTPDFRSLLSSTISEVESANAGANTAVQGFLAGDNQELHSTILAAERAELQMSLFMQARNKVVSAYQEVMRMQV